MDKVPINWGLISNPLNWVVVVLMVAIAGVAGKIFASKLSGE